MLGWAGNRDAGSGCWVLENPTDQQIQVLQDAAFPYVEKANFADVDLLERAGATFYSPARESAAVRAFTKATIDESRLPPIMFGMGTAETPGPAGYIIRSPTEPQIEVFRREEYDFRKYFPVSGISTVEGRRACRPLGATFKYKGVSEHRVMLDAVWRYASTGQFGTNVHDVVLSDARDVSNDRTSQEPL